jgi:hypothetical protein
MNSNPCSDTAPAPRPTAGLIVLEGMPGAGKTITAHSLADQGRTVIGEYTDSAATTIAISMHPGVDDDDAHQQNWLRKATQCRAHLASGRTVYADRDWLSALSYACSVAGTDDGGLLRQRASWAAHHLRDGSLDLPAIYLIFDLDPGTSLARRAARLRPGHPWNQPDTLRRLRDFYASPSRALSQINPGLASALQQPRRIDISGLADPSLILRRVAGLASRP